MTSDPGGRDPVEVLGEEFLARRRRGEDPQIHQYIAEHREYAPGDDLRYVDWKVFGRTDKFYLKQFEEETNLISYLLLDRKAQQLCMQQNDCSL